MLDSLAFLGTETERAYLAGLIDGEGAICIYRRGPKSSKWHQVVVAITNTNLPVLEYAKALFGWHGRLYKKTSVGDVSNNGITSRKDCYEIQWTSKTAELVLETVLPYLRIKKREAEIALEFRQTFKEHHSRRPVTENVYEIRNEMMLSLRDSRKQR